MAEWIEIKGEGKTVELLLHSKYGVRGRELVEKTFALNPGLAAVGVFLPLGTRVLIPDLPPQVRTEKRVVTLFG